MEKKNDDLRKVIKDRLLSLKITNAEIHKKTGIPKGTISGMMSDNPSISIENLHKIATTFGVSMDYLFGLTNLKCTDKDYRKVTEITGLSDQAIKNIEELFSKYSELPSSFKIEEDPIDGYKFLSFKGMDNFLSSDLEDLISFFSNFEKFIDLNRSFFIYVEPFLDQMSNDDVDSLRLMNIIKTLRHMKERKNNCE